MASRPIPRTGEPLPGRRARHLADLRRGAVGRRAGPARRGDPPLPPGRGARRRLLPHVRPRRGGGRGPPRRRARPRRAPFLATKVWTTGKTQGEAQMRESMRRLRTDRIDLMQVHNLLDWETHLPVLRAWKEQGRIRYLGVTHYAPSSFPLLEKLIATEKLDFVQLPYSIATARGREAAPAGRGRRGRGGAGDAPLRGGRPLLRGARQAAAALGRRRSAPPPGRRSSSSSSSPTRP